MLGACAHGVNVHSRARIAQRLSATSTSALMGRFGRPQAGPTSIRSLRQATRSVAAPGPYLVLTSRGYAKKKKQQQEEEELDDAFLDEIKWEEDDAASGYKSLDSFFGEDQLVGETRIYQRPAKKTSEPTIEEEYVTDAEEQRQIEEELRKQFNATESEFEMAMGLSTFRAVDKKGSPKISRTVALEKLAQSGELSLSDLTDLDYDSLKSFATQHEIQVEDFFKRTKTPEGEVSEFTMTLGGTGRESIFEDAPYEGLIENSREYRRTMRASPKNFRDRIRIRCLAGSGGKGGVSFYRDTRVHRGPPDGGDGGDGGSVIFMAAENRKPSLASLNPSYRAGSGMPGSRTRRKGKSGADVIIEVPLGTTITEFRSKNKGGADPVSGYAYESPEEMEPAAPTKSELFMNPELASEEERADMAKQAEAIQKALETDPNTIEDPILRIKAIDERHKAMFSDPRTGRPFEAPDLPTDHPMHDSASEFHRIISGFTNKASNASAETAILDAQDDEKTTLGATSFDKTSNAAPSPVFSFDGEEMPEALSRGKRGSKKNAKSPVFVSTQGLEDMMALEEELGLEDSNEIDYVYGSDLVEKYRLRSPHEKDQSASPQANMPRTVELDEPGAYFVAAKGGAGGLGNFRLGAVRNKPQAVGTPGKAGESLIYQLELKLIADVGLVGFPNAGKSTFLSSVSRASPKIASYPFTTLSPEIGTVKMEDETQFTIADLPGLIEGAHANRGLGHQFLRHIERTSALAYVIDMSDEKKDPWKAFLTLWDELERYQASLVRKPSIVIANKMDAGSSAQNRLQEFSKQLKADKHFKGLKIYPISASSRMNTLSVISALRRMLGYPDMEAPETKRRTRLTRAKNSGMATVNMGSHFGDAMRNIK